jgi:hypothetical protein
MKSIQLIGKDFHFGIGFLAELLENTGLELTEIDTKLTNGDISLFPEMVYCSHLYACKRKKQDITFDMYDVHDWIDENGGIGGKFVTDFVNAFKDSMFKDVPVEEAKKKAKVVKK